MERKHVARGDTAMKPCTNRLSAGSQKIKSEKSKPPENPLNFCHPKKTQVKMEPKCQKKNAKKCAEMGKKCAKNALLCAFMRYFEKNQKMR